MDEHELNLIRQMAMADGVLSENEKALFRELLGMSEEEKEKFFEEIESELESVQSETEVIDWKCKNGLDFEKYVVGLLPDDYKNLKWTGDKFADGRFDERNLQPDIMFDIELNESHTVAIECKFRMTFYKDMLFVAKQAQLERYMEYEKENGVPVYIAVGVGGCGAHPEEMYLIPVRAIKYQFATREYLKQFAREVDKKLFYYVKGGRLY